MCSLSYKQFVFKIFNLHFVRSLDKNDRAAFKYWCKDRIPGAKLDINIDDDGHIFNVIEFLENDLELSFTDTSFLKEFLLYIEHFDLYKELEKVELRIAICILLEDYKHSSDSSDSSHQGSAIVGLLVSTREKNQELIFQTLEQLRQAGEEYSVDGVIQDCQLKPESWGEVSVLLVIMAELYSEAEVFKATIDLLAEWMQEHGGLKAYERFIRKKLKVNWSSIGESLKETLKLIGHEVDKEYLNNY